MISNVFDKNYRLLSKVFVITLLVFLVLHAVANVKERGWKRPQSTNQLTERPAKPQTLSKGHITDFGETWLVWPTHGSGWPPIIFLVWGHPCGRGSPTLGLILVLMAKSYLVAPIGSKWKISYILVKALMGNFQFRTRLAIFWRGHRCKKIFWDFWDFSF